MSHLRRVLALLGIAAPACLFAQDASSSARHAATATKVGPARGTVIVVGGGAMGPEVYNAFIQAAGGPNALIIIVPTAGGGPDSSYTQNYQGKRGWMNAGAKHLYVLHTTDRKLADTDSFVAMVNKAGGVWFDGGRQFHLVDSYAGTKTEKAFNDVLARGGVIGGSSAGASILGDFLVRGAPSNNNYIMDSPGYEKGFAYLRNVGIDQHVVARERLADLADSIVPTHPNLLAISEDEGTAWVVKGDTARIIGRDKAFVYNGKDAYDDGKPFTTLYPGDRFDLATRKVIHRAAADAPFKISYIDSLFSKYNDSTLGGATVLVAENGETFVDRSYGIAPQAKYMPTTTVPQFRLAGLQDALSGLCSQIPEPPARGRGADSAGAARGRGGRSVNPATLTPIGRCVTRLGTPIGWHKTAVSSAKEGDAATEVDVVSDVDELYRLELGLENPRGFARDTTTKIDIVKGWKVDEYRGQPRLALYGTPDGKRNAFVRFPDRKAAIIILTNDENADAKGIADRIADRLLTAKKRSTATR